MANNIKGDQANVVVAKQTISFEDAGVTALNTEIIYEVSGGPLRSYRPGRDINGITSFVINRGYYFVAKTDIDMEDIVVPPLDGIIQLSTPTGFTATAAGANQLNLAWTEVPNASNYVIDRASNSGFTSGVTLGIYTGTDNAFNDTGRTASTTYYYRVRAVASGYVDSNYATALGTTAAISGAENIVFKATQNATADGNKLTSTGTLPSGATATKKLVRGNGNYVQFIVDSTVANNDKFILVLDTADDSDYVWGTAGHSVLSALFVVGAEVYGVTGETDTAENVTDLSPITAGDLLRMEVSGTDVLCKRSTNGGTSFTTLHTYTAVLAATSQPIVKVMVGLAAVTGFMGDVTGLGLTA